MQLAPRHDDVAALSLKFRKLMISMARMTASRSPLNSRRPLVRLDAVESL